MTFSLKKLVLKGGNALRLIYGFGSRSSLDIDVSIEEDFTDLEDVKRRLSEALSTRFKFSDLHVFDFSFELRPSIQAPGDRWGGYQVLFKLIELEKHKAFEGNLESIRRNALIIGPEQMRKFAIDLSKYEYCIGKKEVELEGFSIYVYTTAMIAVEKLRAICQQMESYPIKKHRQPRARDFYDIHVIAGEGKTDLVSLENWDLIGLVFAAKDVPVSLLWQIEDEREFHRVDWPAVQASVSGVLKDFDFYFDFVVEQVKQLKSFRIE
jgi:hypothetical protein